MAPCRSRVPLAALVFAVVVASCSAGSVSVGCFKNDKALALQAVPGDDCESSCLENKLPVWGTMDGACYGTMVVPHPSLKQAGTGDCGSGYISLSYYMDSESSMYTCDVQALPFTKEYWNGLETVSVKGEVATFTINGIDKTVAKIFSKQKTGYGLYSAKIQVAGPDEGPVSAMYTTTHDQSSAEAPKTWDELDYEFANYCGDKNCKPASGWANTFKDGKNEWDGVTWGKVMWTDPTVFSERHLYTFSWHPNNVFWYKDLEFMYTEGSSDHPLPWQDSYTVFVLWWNNEKDCKWFGGCGNRSKSYSMTVEDIRQLTCTKK